MKIAIYARYSSDLQRETSIEDQVRSCQQYAEKLGGKIVQVYTDSELSGTFLRNRGGMMGLLKDVGAGKFDVIVAEHTNRLARDAEDIHHIHKRLVFNGTKLFTVGQGEVTSLQIGFSAISDSDFIKNLRLAVKRGQSGAVKRGVFPSSYPYGYDLVRGLDDRGEPIRGKAKINEEKARIIRRIYEEFAEGLSAYKIAGRLNKEGVPSPRDKKWTRTVIHGNRKRRNGILCNPMYAGKIYHNRQSGYRNPDTGKKQWRLNSEDQVYIGDAPELRIVDQELWDRVQVDISKRGKGELHRRRRAKHLLSGLVFCGVCGGSCSIVYRTHLGCSAYHAGRTCTNQRIIRSENVEERVIKGFREKLMAPHLVEANARKFREQYARHRATLVKGRSAVEKELAVVERKVRNLVAAIEDGSDMPDLRDRLREQANRRDELRGQLKAVEQPSIIDLHPNLDQFYRRKVEQILDTIDKDGIHETGIRRKIRSWITRVVLYPGKKRGAKHIGITLEGNLIKILDLGTTPADEVGTHPTHSRGSSTFKIFV